MTKFEETRGDQAALTSRGPRDRERAEARGRRRSASGRIGEAKSPVANRRSPIENRNSFGVLAQLVERLNGIEEVRGSNPLGSTIRDGGVSRSERFEPWFDYPRASAIHQAIATLVEPDAGGIIP